MHSIDALGSARAAPAALDAPFYYLNNFQTVLDWVGARYGDLLAVHELRFIEAFACLPRASRGLLVRMIMRKGTLFRASKLRYTEIGSAAQAVRPLLELGWVDDSPELALDELFALSTKTEITAAFASPLGRAAQYMKKPELLAELWPLYPEARRFDAWYEGSEDRIYRLTLMETCDRLRLMFFGNLHQDWSDFVLVGLGVYRYETVEFDTASRAFESRDDVDAYLHLHRCRERFEADQPLADILDEIPRCEYANHWLESRRAKLLFQLGRHCERIEDLPAALALYIDSTHPEARIRRLRVLERSEQLDAALALAEEIEQTPVNDAEMQCLQRILPRLHRKLGLPKLPRPTAKPIERIDLVLPRPDRPLPVEEVVRQHLSEAQAPVYYVENGLINSLFGLLCWEAIFAPLPGAFFHPFHSGPADLLRADFRQRRALLFEACLAQLQSDAYKATIRANFQAKQGIQSPFVYWSLLDDALLEQALVCLPREHLHKWFERLLGDIKSHRAGLPDLIQLRADDAQASCRYRMIEVKGPGDRLQDNQLRWLAFCAEHDMPVAVCYVQWAEESIKESAEEKAP